MCNRHLGRVQLLGQCGFLLGALGILFLQQKKKKIKMLKHFQTVLQHICCILPSLVSEPWNTHSEYKTGENYAGFDECNPVL